MRPKKIIHLVLESNLGQQACSATRLALLEYTEETLPDSAGFLAGVNALPDASLLVVVNNRTGLVVVGRQSLLEGGLVVIASLDEGLAGNVISHVRLWGVEDLVVRAARCRVDQTASNSGNEKVVVDAELNGVLERHLPGGKHLVEALGLSDSTWETIKNETRQNCTLALRAYELTLLFPLPL